MVATATFFEVLQALRPVTTDDVFGKCVTALLPMADGCGSVSEQGSSDVIELQDAVDPNLVSDIADLNDAQATALRNTVRSAIADGNHTRRSTNALSRLTGLTPDAVIDLLEGLTEFRVSTGRNSGRTMVSLRNTDNTS